MTSKVLATITAVVGSIAVFYSIFAAFGVELSQAQQEAITGFAGIVLVVAGIWLHPSTPLGEQPPPPPSE